MDDLDPDGKFSHGLPEQHDSDVQLKYARYRLAVYKIRTTEWKNELLKEFFKEDFNSFTQPMFRGLPLDIRRDLRQHLREHGVFVPIGANISTPVALMRAVHEDLQNLTIMQIMNLETTNKTELLRPRRMMEKVTIAAKVRIRWVR